jgi:RHS repeat-associated protein
MPTIAHAQPMVRLTGWTLAVLALLAAAPGVGHAQSGVSDDRVAVPDGPGSVEGLGDNATLDRNMGLMAYQVAFELPKGFPQATPALGLTYSTGTGNSVVGIGWTLDTPSIERLTLRGLPAYTADDELAADGGTQLVRVATTATTATYRARFEGSFVRYTWHDAGPAGYFTAEYPDGSVGYFGATAAGALVPEARLAGPTGATFRYHLVERVDAHDHHVKYTYQLVDGAPYLVGIGYVFDDAGTPRYTVTLSYTARGDLVSDCKPGFDQQTNRKLATVAIAVAGEQLRRYALTYESASLANGLSRLAKVEQFGRAGTRYPVVFTFGYSRSLGGLCPSGACDKPFVVHMGALPTGSAMHSGTATLVDINGDALPDVLDTSVDGFHAFVLNRFDGNGRSSFDPIVRHSVVGTRSGFSVEKPTVQELDVNGDGLTDLVNVAAQTVLCNSGKGDWTNVGCQNNGDLGLSLAGGSGDPAGVRFLDVDGDRRIDALQTVSDQSVIVRRNTGAGFETLADAQPIDVTFDQARLFFADMNGDNLLDPVHVLETGAVRYRKHLGRAHWGPWIDVPGPALTASQLDVLSLEDLNGDGLDDLVLVEPDAVSYALNHGGASFDAAFTRITAADVPGLPTRAIDTTVLFADMNANGSLDIVWIQLDGNVDYVELFPVQPNLLARIENGLGMVQEITYGTAVDQRHADPTAWTLPLSTPANLVTQVDTWTTLTGGEHGAGLHEISTYRYRDGYYAGREKEFRGFARVEATSAADGAQDSQEPGRTIETYDVGATDDYRKGLLLTSVRASGAPGAERVLNEDRHQYADCTLTGVPATGLKLPVRYLCEQDHTTIAEEGAAPDQWATMKTTSTYDGYGRVTLAANLGVVNRGAPEAPQACPPCSDAGGMCGAACTGDEQYTATAYVDPATGTGGRWMLDLPSRVQHYAAPGGLSDETDTYYDGGDFTGLALGQATRGDVTRTSARVSATAMIDTRRASYDRHGNILVSLDPLGSVADGAGHRRTYTYDATGQRIVRTDIAIGGAAPYALRREYSYDPAFDEVAEATGFMTVGGGAPASGRKAMSARYDEFGRRIAIIEPGDTAATPTMEYQWLLGDPATRIVEKRRSVQGATPDLERVICVDGRGRTYQERKQLVGTLYQVTGFTSFNSRGAPVRIYLPYLRQGGFCDTAEPTGVAFEAVRYDATHREVHRTFPAAEAGGTPTERSTVFGPLTSASYDEDDLDPTSPNANTPTITSTDGLGRTIAVERTLTAGAAGPTTRAGYDELGRLATLIDPAGGRKTQTYDLRGRLLTINDPSSGMTQLEYDDAGNVVRRTDARGVVAGSAYDGANRLLSTWDDADPDGTRVAFQYDFGGTCDPTDCGNAEGQAIEISYPLDPELVARIGGAARGADHFGFDVRGQRVFEDRALGRARLVTHHVFDNAGRMITTVHPDGRRLDSAYDGASRLTAIGGVITEVKYGDRGEQLGLTRASGVTDAWTYDGRLRVNHRTVAPGQGLPLEDLGYTRDAIGSITSMSEAATLPPEFRTMDATFAYDAWHRVTTAGYAGDAPEVQTRTYDATDNVMSIASSLGAASEAQVGDLAYDQAHPNAVSSARGVTYGYDAAGFMIARGDLAYAWDYLGRLTGAKRGDVSVARFSYGAGMSRVARIEGTAITLYASDDYEVRDGIGVAYPRVSGHRVARLESATLAPVLLGDPAPLDGADGEVNAADAWIAYAAGAKIVASTAPAAEPHELLRSAARRVLMEAGDGAVALHADHLGSLDLATDAAGKERGRRHFIVPAGDSARSGYVDEYGFTGQEEVPSIGLIRFEYRWLDPLTMRWARPDPAFEQLGTISAARAGESTDRYAYVGNDLANTTDPLGLLGEHGNAAGEAVAQHNGGQAEAGVAQPGAAVEQPGAVAQQPGAVAQQPGAAAQQPGAAVQQPGAVAQQPGAGQQPGATASQPGGQAALPGAPRTEEMSREHTAPQTIRSAAESACLGCIPSREEVATFRGTLPTRTGKGIAASTLAVAASASPGLVVAAFAAAFLTNPTAQ